jgi:hypothetical protein
MLIVRGIEREGGDRHINGAARGGDHAVTANHHAGWCRQWAAGSVLKTLAGAKTRLFTHYSIAAHILPAAKTISDDPVTGEQGYRFRAVVLDRDRIGPNIFVFVGLGLAFQELRAHNDPDVFCDGLIHPASLAALAGSFPPSNEQGQIRPLAPAGVTGQ